MNEQLKARILSFLWRVLLAAIVAAIAMAVKILPDLGLNEMITAVVILILNEITKALNDKYEIGTRALSALGRKA